VVAKHRLAEAEETMPMRNDDEAEEEELITKQDASLLLFLMNRP